MFKAKRGQSMTDYDVVTDDEVNELGVDQVCKLVDERLHEAWQRRWDESVDGRVTYGFIKNVRFASCTRAFEPSLRVCYILTGHGTLNAWLYERKLTDSPTCLCGAECEDWVHVLCVCPMYECFRNLDEMGVIVGMDGSFDFRSMLSTREQYECMCAFIERAYRMRFSVIERVNAESRVNER